MPRHTLDHTLDAQALSGPTPIQWQPRRRRTADAVPWLYLALLALGAFLTVLAAVASGL